MNKSCTCTVCEFHSACNQLIDKDENLEIFPLIEYVDMLHEIITTEFGMVVSECHRFLEGASKAPYEFTNYSNLNESHLHSEEIIDSISEVIKSLNIQNESHTDCILTLKAIIKNEIDFNRKVLDVLSENLPDHDKALKITQLSDNSNHRKESREVALQLKKKYKLKEKCSTA